jgi:uncharacterized protein (DUF1330 family)
MAKAAYMVVRMYIRETHWIKDYLEKVPPILRSFGGEYVFSSPLVHRLEGNDAVPDFITVFAFPSLHNIETFMNCEAYRPYKEARQAHSSASIFAVEIQEKNEL